MKANARRGRLAVAVQIVAFAVAGGLFTYQLYKQVAHYLSHPITTAVTLRLPPSLFPPPIIVCPEYPFHLEVLRDLGMNTDNMLLSNISSLQDLDPNKDVLQVWENSALQLGQVVHSFTFGNLEENYTVDTLSSSYWRRVTTPLGSCLTLRLPPITDPGQELPSLIISLRKRPFESSCPFKPYECTPSKATQLCNSSCAFERFVSEHAMGSYYVLIGKLYNEESQHHDGIPESNTDYLLAEEAWSTAYLGTSYEPLNVIEIHSTLVERWPLKCDLTAEASVLDFDTCADSYFLSKNSCIPVRPNVEMTLKEACKVGVMQEAIIKKLPGQTECSGPLTNQCHSVEWEHEVKSGLDIGTYTKTMSQVRLNFTSPKVRVEEEVDMYPLSQLASDIGGSLGMFLGMSLLTVWQCVGVYAHQFLPQRSWGRQFNRRHCRHFMYWVAIVSLAFFTAVHSLLVLQMYITQPVRVSVKRADTAAEDPDQPDTHDYLPEQVAALLASRAMDCRAGPLTSDEECILKCLMWETMKQISSVAPFVEVDDLPLCPDKHNWTYSVTYVVPSLPYTAATDNHSVKHCRRKCGEVILRPPRGLRVNHQYYSMTVNDLLCSFGGIISLYAGLFLTSAIKLVVHLMPSSTSSTRLLRTVVKVALGSVIYVSGGVMAIFLLYRYIFDHPVSSNKQVTSLTSTMQPILTVCYWPPFKPGAENSSLSVDEVWAASEWNKRVSRAAITRGLGRLTRDDNDYNVTSVTTMFNKCDSVTALVLYKNLMVSFYYWWDFNDVVVVGVHSPHDPPFVSHIDKVGLLKALTLSVLTASYRRLSQPPASPDTPTYDTCLYRCVHDMHSDSLGCRLPFITWRPDLPPCSRNAARHHPFWPENEKPPKHPLTRRGNSSHCHAACRQYKTEVLLVWGEKKQWLESGVNLLQPPESFVGLREEDWYPFLQLVNDLGVVAGFTFGASVFSILQGSLLSGLSRF